MISWLRFRYTKTRMTAYLNGQLSTQARHRVARYIDTDQRCYREFIKQRRIHDELQRTLPMFGSHASIGLDRIWQGIQAELTESTPITQPRRRYAVGYGMAVLLFVVAMSLPNWLREQLDTTSIMPTHPAPMSAFNTTPSPVEQSGEMPHHAVSLSLTEPVHTQTLLLQNTPAPRRSTR